MISLNVGDFDRTLRILLGVALVGLAATGRVGARGYVGIVPLWTGAMAWCPIYLLSGVRTSSR